MKSSVIIETSPGFAWGLSATMDSFFSSMFCKSTWLALFLSPLCIAASAPDIQKQMRAATEFGNAAADLVQRNGIHPYWSAESSRLIYQVRTEKDEFQYVQVDPSTGEKSPAFNHEVLAATLGEAANQDVTKDKLELDQLVPAEDGKSLTFRAFGKSWRYSIPEAKISPSGLPPKQAELQPPGIAIRGSKRTGAATQLTLENGTPAEIEIFWVNGEGQRKSYGKIPSGQSRSQQTYAGHAWLVTDSKGAPMAGVEAVSEPSLARITESVKPASPKLQNISPNGNWRAVILNHNLVIEPVAGGNSITLTTDGTEEQPYTRPMRWAPDSNKLIAFRVKKVKVRQIQLLQSSPPDQVQPKMILVDYPKPGDDIPQPLPHLFDVEHAREVHFDQSLFANPWKISDMAWTDDSSEFTFVYNQRGHQVMRILGIRADSAEVRTILEDTSDTFIDYSQKFFIHRLPGSREILWASERKGYNHLYLVDAKSGKIKNPITHGRWNVREVVEVDEKKRQLLLKISGIHGQDPYHIHYATVGFDGSGFTRLTDGDGEHSLEFSPDLKYYTDTWSRVDLAPVVELRQTDDGKLITELERADDSALRETGWSRPERFTAKGRDGLTDIYGIIIRPTHFDPARKYPVLEQIYAGPHDQHVRKSYAAWSDLNAMAELGFVIVSIDGMGTNWRNKVFQDVCWKNLADSGFPDRIPWIKAAAATRPWMDLSRVGIYGGSAGGQSALAALLHHGDFYKVAVADCGCHDNRMDKIWWNEAWMGWPVDESYERNSNVTHVEKLTGRLMLIVGELDTNVDPASTSQVVAALQQADKDFEYLPIMNTGHGAAETPYGKRRRAEYLVRNLGAE